MEKPSVYLLLLGGKKRNKLRSQEEKVEKEEYQARNQRIKKSLR